VNTIKNLNKEVVLSLKKLAIFVEGYTESKFILKLLKEFFNQKSIAITINDNENRKECPIIREIISSTDETKFEILIFNSCTDNKVLSDLLERYSGLKGAGYSQFIGIRDLYPTYTYEEKDEAIARNKKILSDENISNTTFIFATMEVETWFLAEKNHYSKISFELTLEHIANNCIALSEIENFEKDIAEPARQLNKIYQLVGLGYSKKDRQITRTVESLDYENLYLHVRNEVPSLNKLFKTIEAFIE
jgi:hypothetical protein